MLPRTLIVLAIVGIVSFEVYAIFRVVQSPIQKKLRWCLLCLVGITEFQMAWNLAGSGFNPFSIRFLGFAIIQSGGGPWVVSVSFPVGALLALRKVEALNDDSEAETKDAESRDVE